MVPLRGLLRPCVLGDALRGDDKPFVGRQLFVDEAPYDGQSDDGLAGPSPMSKKSPARGRCMQNASAICWCFFGWYSIGITSSPLFQQHLVHAVVAFLETDDDLFQPVVLLEQLVDVGLVG